MALTIYGASDDLIEIEGDIVEEFNPTNEEASYLAFSDGTVLKIVYDNDGNWRISPLAKGKAHYEIVQASGEDNYSDRVTLSGEKIKWSLFSSEGQFIKR